MEADFMVQQEQLQNKVVILLLVLASCKEPEKTFETGEIICNTDISLISVNGIVYKTDKLFTGTVYSLYPNDNDTAELKVYLNGRENGQWKKLCPDGSLKEKREFEYGKKTGEYIAFWENGNKMLDYFFENDEYEGTCREWNSEGILIKEMNYKKGYEDGSQKMFYDNGKVRSNYMIINGRRFGLLGTKNCVNVSDSVFNK